MASRKRLSHIPVELLSYIFENLTLTELDALERACVHNRLRFTINALFRRRVIKSRASPLLELVQIKRDEEIEWLASQPVFDVNIADKSGQTPLHIAAERGYLLVVQALFRFPTILIDQRDYAGRSPLVLAAQSGHTEVVRVLLQQNAEIDLPTCRGMTALICAARNGHGSTVKLLLSSHADALKTDTEGWKALDWAVIHGKGEIVNLLLCHHHHFQGVSGELDKILLLAAESGNNESIRKILETGADINCRDDQESTPLQRAVSFGHHATVELLLEWGADPDSKDMYGNTPLHWAITHPRITHLLLNDDVDVNAQNGKGKTSLMCSVFAGQEETALILLNTGQACVNIQDENGCTALHAAAARGNKSLALRLMEQGANLRVADVDGWRPAHTAAVNGHLAIAALLDHETRTGTRLSTAVSMESLLQNEHTNCILKEMAHRKPAGIEGVSGLRSAVNSKHTNRLLDMLENGVDIDELDPLGGATALTLASWFNDENSVQLLLKNGAAIDATDFDGRTALHVAVEGGYCDLVALLANKGANVEAKYCGWTPLLLAARRLWDKEAGPWMVGYLSTKMASVNLKATDYYGRGVLHWCAVYGETEIMTDLLTIDSTLMNVKDHYDQSLLHYAIGAKCVDIVRMLLQQGVDPTGRSRDGLTSAHIAAYTGQLDVLGLLRDVCTGNRERDGCFQTSPPPGMELGLNTEDEDGYTPLTIALLTGNLHVAQFLRQLPGGDEGGFQYRDSVTYPSITAWRPPPLQLPAEEETVELNQLSEGVPPRKPLFDATVREWLRDQFYFVASKVVSS